MDFPQIEGPAAGRDISYSIYFSECKDLGEIEKGIPIDNYPSVFTRRNIDLEYRLLRKLTQTKKHMDYLIPNSPFLQGFNRYSDILPYSDTIVKVSSGEYINANWVSGAFSQNFFIATQGPLPLTRNSFWKIIWEHEVPLIIMISAIKEAGKVKCDQYFPEDAELSTEDFEISLTNKEEMFGTLTVREFELRCGQESKKVRHLQSLAWPDHGTPELEEEFESIKYMIEQALDSAAPVLVHCSAGVGRTGTLIALCHLVQAIASKGLVSIFGTVRRLREQRWGMVQTKDQYDFLYRFIECWLSRL